MKIIILKLINLLKKTIYLDFLINQKRELENTSIGNFND